MRKPQLRGEFVDDLPKLAISQRRQQIAREHDSRALSRRKALLDEEVLALHQGVLYWHGEPGSARRTPAVD